MSNDRKDPPGLVFGDAGGWISGPALDSDQLERKQLGGPWFGINVGAWMKEYGGRCRS